MRSVSHCKKRPMKRDAEKYLWVLKNHLMVPIKVSKALFSYSSYGFFLGEVNPVPCQVRCLRTTDFCARDATAR